MKISSRLAAKALPHIPKETGKARALTSPPFISGPGLLCVLSAALQPTLTLQVADPGLWPELQQSPHEEL